MRVGVTRIWDFEGIEVKGVCDTGTSLAANAGPDGDPEALFDTMIRAQIDMVRRMQKIQRERAEG
ncbi:hypothetical protein ACH4FE_35445 [Streptomyces celluloflavus]|uniref:hypothetical protein n=1 Tax=Streptomyces celluloflavus TaxID=58344 RepID=UPI0037964CB8